MVGRLKIVAILDQRTDYPAPGHLAHRRRDGEPDDDECCNRGADGLGKSDQGIRTGLKGRAGRLGEDGRRNKKGCRRHEPSGESAAEADFNELIHRSTPLN